MDSIVLKSDILTLRLTQESDLDFVLKSESNPENSPYVYQWKREQHLRAMEDENIMHIIIEKTDSKHPIGYMFITGIANPNKSIELTRIVIVEKGKGYGRESLRLVKRLAFEKLMVHRLWLDVKSHNHNALKLYRSEGFIEEGTMRENVFYKGNYESMIVFSMLENEYENEQNAGGITC